MPATVTAYASSAKLKASAVRRRAFARSVSALGSRVGLAL